jgi:hypothetical protein
MLCCSVTFWAGASAQQAQPGDNPASNTKPVPQPQVGPDVPVLTIEGLCPPDSAENLPSPAPVTPAIPASAQGSQASPDSGTPPDAGCKTVLTRAEFEKLLGLLRPGFQPSTGANFARRYAESLLFAQRAHEAGFDQDPTFLARLRFNTLQFISQSYSRQISDKAQNVSDADAATYYQDHLEMFDQVDLMRVFIPSLKAYPVGPNEPQQPPERLASDKDELAREAQKIHSRAVAGRDFEKLELSAYKLAGNPEQAPAVHMGKLTRGEIPADRRDLIFGLKIGQISDLVPESNGWSIFKVLSKGRMPLSEAKPQVRRLKTEAALDAVKSSAKIDLNTEYFADPNLSTVPPSVR